MAPPPPSSRQCTCGANTGNTTPKKSKKKSNSNSTNPYADRGREKFAALLVEVEDQRKKIMAEVGKDDVSLIRFVCTKENKLKPVVVKSNNNSSNSSSDRSFKGKAKTLLDEKVSIVGYDDGKVVGDEKEETLEEKVKVVDDYDEKVIVGNEVLKLETNSMNKQVDDDKIQNGLIVFGLGSNLKKPVVGLSKNKSNSSSRSSGGDRSFKGRGKTLEEKMKIVDDDEKEDVEKGIMLFGVEDRRLLVKKLKAEVAKMQLQPYLCYLATLLIIVSVTLASFGNNWSYMYLLQMQARLCRSRP